MKFDVRIVQLPSKVLRKKSTDVSLPLNKEDDLLAQQMIYHVTDSIKEGSRFRPAVGVAAIQYGIPKNMFFVHILDSEDNLLFSDVIINPKVIGKSDGMVALKQGEGCLSVKESYPNQEGFIKRSERIVLDAYSYKEKKIKRFDCKQFVAIVFQHELDHLDGKLFIDHIDHKNPWTKDDDLKIL
ncbi:MAG: peptide deformylase [Metamycoplasmataceae bacterium]